MTAPVVKKTGQGAGASRIPVATPEAPSRVTNMRIGAREIMGRFSELSDDDALSRARQDLIVGSMERGMSLSNYLEELDPSHEYGASDPMGSLDAFERQLLLAGIRTQSDPSKRIFADPVERFYASDQPASPVLFPEFINRQMRTPLLAASILDEIVAITTPIDSDTYRSIYLTDQVTDRRMRRVSEGSELPTVKLTTSEHPITLHKYGVKLQGTYEVFRRMRLDLFSLHLARIALQAQIDKASEGVDVLINGDGNANGATNFNLTTLDSGTTAGNLTYKAWLRWGLKLFPYQLNTVVAGEAELLSILTLQFPNVNPLMLLSMLTQGQPVEMRLEVAQGIWTTIRLVFLSTAPSNVLVGFNRQSGLEMVTEIGSTLTETDRLIGKQMNEITLSEVVAFAVLFQQAVTTLTLNA